MELSIDIHSTGGGEEKKNIFCIFVCFRGFCHKRHNKPNQKKEEEKGEEPCRRDTSATAISEYRQSPENTLRQDLKKKKLITAQGQMKLDRVSTTATTKSNKNKGKSNRIDNKKVDSVRYAHKNVIKKRSTQCRLSRLFSRH